MAEIIKFQPRDVATGAHDVATGAQAAPPLEEAVTAKKHRYASQKRLRNLASNVSVAMNTIMENAQSLQPREAEELTRRLHDIRREALRLENLVIRITGCGTPGDDNN